MFLHRRSRSRRFVRVFIVVAIFVGAVSQLEAETAEEDASRIEDLFIDFSISSNSLRSIAGAETRSARQVRMNPKMQTADRMSAGDSFNIALFNGEERTATIKRMGQDINGTFTLSAEIDGSEWGYFILSTTGEKSLGFVAIPEAGENYAIRPRSAEVHLLEELSAKDWDNLLCGAVEPPSSGLMQRSRNSVGDLQMFGNPYDPVTIDLLIAYTRAAREWADQWEGGVFNVIALALERANLVLENSDTKLSWNLVGTLEVDYEESGDSNLDLIRLTTSETFQPYGLTRNGQPLTGFMDEVHEVRDEVGADLVTLMTATADVGGMAWILGNQNGSPDWAFNISRIQQATWTSTLVHELGHNLGLGHHHAQNFQKGPGIFPYSSGSRWTGEDNRHYGSVMSYHAGSYYVDGLSHTEVLHFSNPDVYHAGVPTGDYRIADNARTVRELKEVVASYRHHNKVTFGEALDQTTWEWKTGGESRWFVNGTGAGGGGYAAQSGSVLDDQESWLETTVEGPGLIHFWVQVSSEENYDFLIFYVGGDEMGRFSGEIGWQRKTFSIPMGSHTLRWVYRKDRSVSHGADAAWIDGINWDPVASMDPASYKEWLSISDLPVDQQGILDDPGNFGVPNWIRYAFGLNPHDPERSLLPTAELLRLQTLDDVEDYLGIRFRKGEKISDLIYRPEVSSDLVNWEPIEDPEFQVESEIDENGVWQELVVRDWVPLAEEARRFLRVSVLSRIGEVLGEPFRDWRTGGSKPWFSQEVEFFSENRSMQSGGIGSHEQTWIETTFQGPGLLRFYWKSSTELGWDLFTFEVDEQARATISGERDWEQRIFFISEGTHRVRWLYTKDFSISDGQDAVWLDRVEWLPE